MLEVPCSTPHPLRIPLVYPEAKWLLGARRSATPTYPNIGGVALVMPLLGFNIIPSTQEISHWPALIVQASDDFLTKK